MPLTPVGRLLTTLSVLAGLLLAAAMPVHADEAPGGPGGDSPCGPGSDPCVGGNETAGGGPSGGSGGSGGNSTTAPAGAPPIGYGPGIGRSCTPIDFSGGGTPHIDFACLLGPVRGTVKAHAPGAGATIDYVLRAIRR